MWFAFCAAIEDESVQRRGVVILDGSPWRPTALDDQDRKLDSLCATHLRYALPVRVVSIHHYVSYGKLMKLLVPFILSVIGPSLRQRYKLHTGDADSYVTALQKCGISADVLPAGMGGKHDFNYSSWVEDQLRRNGAG
jgi:hypothetical protein